MKSHIKIILVIIGVLTLSIAAVINIPKSENKLSEQECAERFYKLMNNFGTDFTKYLTEPLPDFSSENPPSKEEVKTFIINDSIKANSILEKYLTLLRNESKSNIPHSKELDEAFSLAINFLESFNIAYSQKITELKRDNSDKAEQLFRKNMKVSFSYLNEIAEFVVNSDPSQKQKWSEVLTAFESLYK